MSSSPLTSPVLMSDAPTTLGRAFDGVWQEVAGNFSDASAASEIARTRLASIILTLSKVGQLGPDQLKESAIRLLQQQYRTGRAANAER
jgi:hypothetical protein